MLTEGTTKTLKNIKNAVKKIQSLAECLGIKMTNLVSNQEVGEHSTLGSLSIRSLSQQFIDSKVPNVLVENEDNDENLISSSVDDVIEIISSDDEDIFEVNCEVPLEEASVSNDVLVNLPEPCPSIRYERNIGASVNFYNLRSVANNNEKSPKSFICEECELPREFKTAKDLKNHNIMMHLEGAQPRIECIICHGVEKFHTVKDLAKHISTKHGNVPHSCLMCNKVKKPYSAFKLAKHMNRCHQSYKCDICSQEFKHVTNLNLHIVKKHYDVIKKKKSK